jgi:hypothetical protein
MIKLHYICSYIYYIVSYFMIVFFFVKMLKNFDIFDTIIDFGHLFLSIFKNPFENLEKK